MSNRLSSPPPLSGDGGMNRLERLAVFAARALAHNVEAIVGDLRRRHRLHGKRIAGQSVNQKPNIGGVLRKVGQVLRCELAGVFAELLGEGFGIVDADRITWLRIPQQ